MRDFTIDKFEKLCETISKSSYEPITVRDYFSEVKLTKKILIRHDIDIKPNRALAMAKIEKKYGISSTYYIRITKEVFDRKIIQQISKMGHEIGYHYETLDKSKGNIDNAIKAAGFHMFILCFY